MSAIHTIGDYERYIGKEAVHRIKAKARPLRDLHVMHMNSTYYGGGVSQILSSLTLLMNSLGIQTGWRVVHGPPDFFSVTKKFHNALQGARINLTGRKKEVYESVIQENAVRNHLDHDVVFVHDPQPLPLITHYRKKSPWVWRCHLDLTAPNPKVWNYLVPFIEKYDAVVLSCGEYRRDLRKPQVFFTPGIDPFSIVNKELSESAIDERLQHYDIPTDLPLVVQISRFDHWKDPEGVIRAFEKARKEEECTLVLVGNVATDDPEGAEVYRSILAHKNERVIVLSVQDGALVNALQRRAAVVLQKSIREGFGLTVSEAMWKGAAVIGGNVGGIRYQIQDGETGFLVSSVDEAAERIVRLLRDPDLAERLGRAARERVRENFLFTRTVEQYLDMIGSFEPEFRLREDVGLPCR
ncbi:glycosyltransferase [Methanoculleus sp. YWC-01]|uniref:Glycosyltransferase n=1 Tax=Methanoculleus nereidis TaxID=2735141 RepID=A0ABU3Z4R8_9EURY|nr:glycosyltransferase [Methanoculleus sp. YWC-01]MCK9299062.1 glycosyltransferase [Methanoculleus sp.]MDV4343808.1 glycosyltransferase [Methanoculleus sp. YWC-01]PKL55376.1 MAG: glycosyl transferase family 1 [Methanomicrobiales archaeon HGW-Methanomicrobiales-6]